MNYYTKDFPETQLTDEKYNLFITNGTHVRIEPVDDMKTVPADKQLIRSLPLFGLYPIRLVVNLLNPFDSVLTEFLLKILLNRTEVHLFELTKGEVYKINTTEPFKWTVYKTVPLLDYLGCQ